MLHLKRKCNSCNGYNGEKHPKSESIQESYCMFLADFAGAQGCVW